jgi:hypothetical protein
MVNAKPIHLKSAAMDPLLAFKMQRRTCLTVGLSGALLAACGGGGEGGALDGGADSSGGAGGPDRRPGNGGNPNEKVTMEFRLEDYWKATDVRPGFSGPRIDNLGDPTAIEGNPDADFAPAFRRIMKQLTDAHKGGVPAPARITLTSRVAYHFYSTLEIGHPVEIVGIGVPYRSGSSRMRFHGCSGIHVGVFPAGSIHVGSAYMEGLSIEYVGSNTSGNFNGVTLNQTSALTRCSIHKFPGHGLHVEGTLGATDGVTPAGNVSMTYVTMCTVFQCGLSGVWIKGKDAQVMILENVNSFDNGKRGILTDGYGFYDASMLGNTYTACHTRNNLIAGYKADNFAPLAPNRSTYINCYTEHSADAKPEDNQEGPAQLSKNALVITSNGEGNLADAEGGASVIYTDEGRLKLRDVVEVRGQNGISTIMGDSKKHDTPADVNTPRLQSVLVSTAYGTADVDKSKIFHVHDTRRGVRAWATKAGSPDATMAYGVTDTKHLRPGMLVVPNGLLIGRTLNESIPQGDPQNNGPRRIGTHDPRYENGPNGLAATFPNPLLGDVVLCTLVNQGSYNFRGWIFASESTGAGFGGSAAWFRFGEVGAKVGPGTFT